MDRLERLGAALTDVERGGQLLIALPGSLYDEKVGAAGEASERVVKAMLSD